MHAHASVMHIRARSTGDAHSTWVDGKWRTRGNDRAEIVATGRDYFVSAGYFTRLTWTTERWYVIGRILNDTRNPYSRVVNRDAPTPIPSIDGAMRQPPFRVT